MTIINLKEERWERKHPVIQFYSQVVDGMEFYILMDVTNRCLLDSWLMENILSMQLMKQDLAVLGIDI